MNRVSIASGGEATTAPGRGMIPGRVGAGPVEGRGAVEHPGHRLPRRRPRTAGEDEDPRGEQRGGGRAIGQEYPPIASSSLTPPFYPKPRRRRRRSTRGRRVTIFANCMNGVSRSIGTGKMVVELFSAATSRSVWR